MNILFLRRCGADTIAAPRHYHAFEKEVARHVNAEWAGLGWPLYRKNESFMDTVKRVMPDVDWIIDRERDDRLPRRRAFMVGAYLSDLHARGAFGISNLRDYIDSVNNVGYDALFMRYIKIEGTEADPEIFLDELEPAVYFLPWSVDVDDFKPTEKTVDVSFIGSVGKHYPLRRRIWSLLPMVCAEHGANLLIHNRPRGSSSFSDGSEFPDAYFKSRYSEALAQTRIFIFGSSKFKYPLLKYFEGMASGCCVLADEPTCACELGFEDGVNYVKIDESNWTEKLSHCLDHPERAEEIGRNARKLVSTLHSHEARVADFLTILDSFI